EVVAHHHQRLHTPAVALAQRPHQLLVGAGRARVQPLLELVQHQQHLPAGFKPAAAAEGGEAFRQAEPLRQSEAVLVQTPPQPPRGAGSNSRKKSASGASKERNPLGTTSAGRPPGERGRVSAPGSSAPCTSSRGADATPLAGPNQCRRSSAMSCAVV